MRIRKTNYSADWENNKQDQIKKLTSDGIIPVEWDMAQRLQKGEEISLKERMEIMPLLMGQTAGAIDKVETAEEIINSMVNLCVQQLRGGASKITAASSAGSRARL